MNDETIIISGMLALLMIAMLILAGMALTLRGFQTLNATIVSLLAMAFKDKAEKALWDGEDLPQKGAIVAQQESMPPTVEGPRLPPSPPPSPPPHHPPSSNGRGEV